MLDIQCRWFRCGEGKERFAVSVARIAVYHFYLSSSFPKEVTGLIIGGGVRWIRFPLDEFPKVEEYDESPKLPILPMLPPYAPNYYNIQDDNPSTRN